MSGLERWLDQHRRDRIAAGLQRRLRPRGSSRASGRALIDLAGNDYLGLSTDPRVVAAAAQAAVEWGAGAGASRLVTGSLELHRDLEARLATFTGRPAALVLSTGYHANLAAVTALTDPDTLVVSDAHVHASLVDACRLARHGGLLIAGHNDLDDVRAALAERTQRRAIIVVESVYSVLGDAAPLEELAALAAAYDAVLIVDEAHALGVAGPGGRGLVAATGLADRPDVVVTGTLSKAFGSQGGLVLGSEAVVDHLVNTARPFIYDTGLAPASAAAANAALDVISTTPDLPARAVGIASAMATALGRGRPAGAVLSVPMLSPEHALEAQAAFAADGFAVGCFRPPSVPDGMSRLRLTGRAALTDTEVSHVVTRLQQVSAGR